MLYLISNRHFCHDDIVSGLDIIPLIEAGFKHYIL